MKEYKSSRYNLLMKFDNGSFQHVMANTFSGTIMFADDELANFLQKFNLKTFEKLKREDTSLFNYLLENSFVVEASLDEPERVRIRFERAKYTSTHMHLTIVPTEKCNLACIYCYENRDKGSSISLNGRKRLKKFVERRIGTLSSLGITWYGGEPLLEIHAIEDLSHFFIELADANKISYGASMVTNGTLLDDATIDILLKIKVHHLQVTIDGPEDLHNKRRFYRSGQRESYADILNGLKRCAGKIPVGIRINVDKTNISRYKELIDLLCSEKLLGPNSGNAVSLGLVKDWTDCVSMDRNNMLPLEDFQLWMNDLHDYMDKQGLSQKKAVDFTAKVPCGAVSITNFLVTPKGGLKKCWIHATGSAGLVGNLNTGLDLTRAVAVKWAAYDPTLNDKCVKCSLLPVCTGGCPYDMLTKPERKEEFCRFMSTYVESNLLIAAKSKT
jgi:uncharacterized protein